MAVMPCQGSVNLAQKEGRLPKGVSHATVVPPVHQSESNDAGNGAPAGTM